MAGPRPTVRRRRADGGVPRRGNGMDGILPRLAPLLVVALLAVPAGGAAADTFTVEVESDIAITLFANGHLLGSMVAMDSVTFELRPGLDRELWAMGTEAPGVGQRFEVETSYTTELIEVALGEQVEEWVEMDPETRPRAPWPGPLVDLLDGAVLDTTTGLEWRRGDNGRDIGWNRAGRYCEEIQVVAGEPWRLPSLEELETLVNQDYETDFMIQPPIFLSGCCVWSSQEHGTISAWYLSFEGGERGFVAKDYGEGGRVVCVRRTASSDEDEES